MLKLHTIRKHPKSTKRRKVVGRGLGTGHGTYSTRGGKGQTARSGHSKMPAAFEGGRQPLVRQLPKSRGFKSLTAKATAISLDRLAKLEDGTTVDQALLVKMGLVDNAKSRVKIVNGKSKSLARKLTVQVPVTAAASALIISAGGQVIVPAAKSEQE